MATVMGTLSRRKRSERYPPRRESGRVSVSLPPRWPRWRGSSIWNPYLAGIRLTTVASTTRATEAKTSVSYGAIKGDTRTGPRGAPGTDLGLSVHEVALRSTTGPRIKMAAAESVDQIGKGGKGR